MAIVFNKKTGKYETTYSKGIGGGGTPLSKRTTNNSLKDLESLLQISQEAGVNPPDVTDSPNLLNRLVGFLSTGETAPAVMKAIKTGSISEGLGKYKETATKRATLGGLGENISYADVLKELGVGELGSTKLPIVGKVTGRGALGLVGDILLDPTTYLTGGLSAAGKKAGKKSMSEGIEELGLRLAKEAGEEVVTPAIKRKARETYLKSSMGLGRTAVEQAEKGQKSLLNFMGQPIIPKGINKRFYEGTEKLGRKLSTIEPIAKAHEAYRGLLSPKTTPLSKWGDAEFAEKWSRLQEIEQKFKNVRAVAEQSGFKLAKDSTKQLRTFLKGSKDIKEYDTVMKNVVDYVERKVPIDEVPETLKPLVEDLKTMSEAFGERWVKAGGARMTYDNIAYLPHVMNPKIKEAIIAMGGKGAKLFSSQNAADNPRNWIKIVTPKGNSVVGHIDEIKAKYGLEELNVQGLPPGVYSGGEALTLKRMKERLAKMGIELKSVPKGGFYRAQSVKGYYRPSTKQIKIATKQGVGKESVERTFSTLAHETSHANQGLLGEIIELNKTFTGRTGGQKKALKDALDGAVNIAREDWESIVEVSNPGFIARYQLGDITKADKKFMKYLREPTELLAHATQAIYDQGDEAISKIPRVAEALDNLKNTYSAIKGVDIPNWRDIPPDTFQAGIDKILFNKKTGKVFKVNGATIKEINKKTMKDYGVELFSANIPVLKNVMSTTVGSKEAGEEYFRMIQELGMYGSEAPSGWRALNISDISEGSDLVRSTAKELNKSGLLFPPEIVEHIDSMYKSYFSDKALNEVKTVYDKLLNAWKGSVTSIFPAFHGRNFLSNLWQNYVGGVKNPAAYTEAMKIRTKVASGGTLSKSEQAIWEKFTKQGLAGYGQFGYDVSKHIEEELVPRTSLQKLGKAIPGTMEAGREVGEIVEDTARLAHFIDKTKKGFSDTVAASSVRKYLFDYSDLTPFEKNVMKRIMPFYTFSRKNIPMEIEALLTQPGKFSNLVKTMRAGGVEFGETEYLPEWLRGQPITKTESKDGEARYGYGYDIPAFDILNYLEGKPEGGLDPMRSLEKTVGRLASPIIKTPLEWMSGRHWYYGKDLKDTATVYPVAAKALKSIGLDKALGIIEMKNKEGKTYYKTSEPEAWHVFKSLFGRGYAAISKTGESTGPEEILRESLFGISTKKVEPQKEIDARNYELIKRIGQWMERKGLVKKFEKYYKPKEKKGLTRKF